MNELTYEIVRLLINAGLHPVESEALAATIDQMYKESRRQEMILRGSKGGRASGFKAVNELKQTDPARYKQIIKRRTDKRKKTMLDKNANA